MQCNLVLGCGKKIPRKAFSKTQRDKGENRICPDCAAGKTLLQCGKCKATWSRRYFTPAELKQGHNRQCKDCKQCGRCQRYLPSAFFGQCATKTPSYMKSLAKRRCNGCLDETEQELKTQMKRNISSCIFRGKTKKPRDS